MDDILFKETGEQIVSSDDNKIILSNHIGFCLINQTKEKWEEITRNDTLFESLAKKLIIFDQTNKFPEYYIGIHEHYKGNRIIHSCHHLIRFIDLSLQTENCKNYNKIIGFEQRIKESKDVLKANLENVEELFRKLISTNSELIFVANLCKSNTEWDKLELTKEKTPNRKSDFKIYLPKIGIKKIEMKTRIENFVVQDIPYSVEEVSIAGDILHYAVTTSEKAFNMQKADIEFINLTHCYGGFLLGSVNTKNKNMSFEYALNNAIDLVKNGKKAIVLFTELYAPYRLLATTIDEIFLNTGREFLDKIRVILKKKWWEIEPKPDEMMKIIDAITRLELPIDQEKIIFIINKVDSKPHEIDKILDIIKNSFDTNITGKRYE